MKPVPNNLQAFLTFDPIVSINSSIRNKVDEILSSGDNEEPVKAIFEWVRDKIPHSKDQGTDRVTCSSEEAFQHRTGICFSKSHLLASMLRYTGVPCGFCYQIFDNPVANHPERRSLHGLNAIHLRESDSWCRLDPRGNRQGIEAEFSVPEESLAFPEMEFLDDCVYASPLPVVIDGLANAESISELWPELPSVELPRHPPETC